MNKKIIILLSAIIITIVLVYVIIPPHSKLRNPPPLRAGQVYVDTLYRSIDPALLEWDSVMVVINDDNVIFKHTFYTYNDTVVWYDTQSKSDFLQNKILVKNN